MSPHPDVVADARLPYQDGYCQTSGLSTVNGFTDTDAVLSNDRVPQPKPPSLLKTRAERIAYALDIEKKSQAEVERKLGFSKGDMSKYASGQRGGSTVQVDKMAAVARELHVEFDWLVRGAGPMRPGGRDTTPAEEAMALARGSGTPGEACDLAWERYKDRVDTMTALDWAVAIHDEAQWLARRASQPLEPMGPSAPLLGVDARPEKASPERQGKH